jgi:hypothetical protein
LKDLECRKTIFAVPLRFWIRKYREIFHEKW